MSKKKKCTGKYKNGKPCRNYSPCSIDHENGKTMETATIPIDWNTVDQLLRANNSGSSIASRIGVHENTLYGRCKKDKEMDFVAYKAKRRAEGDDLLHTKQFEIGMSGNVTMLIWLGKQRLGQAEKNEVDANVEVNANVNLKTLSNKELLALKKIQDKVNAA